MTQITTTLNQSTQTIFETQHSQATKTALLTILLSYLQQNHTKKLIFCTTDLTEIDETLKNAKFVQKAINTVLGQKSRPILGLGVSTRKWMGENGPERVFQEMEEWV